MSIELWAINREELTKVKESKVDLEKNLEQWIVTDSSMLQSGLIIVGRQIELEGGRLDLLAIDPEGRWIIIEIKRGILRRDTIAQAIDYASSLVSLSQDDLLQMLKKYLQENNIDIIKLLNERDAKFALDPLQREIKIMIVGTGKAPGLERIIEYLAGKHNLPISVITFEVFEIESKQILARQITEKDNDVSITTSGKSVSIEQVLELSSEDNNDVLLRRTIERVSEIGLFPRAWKTSVMFTPQANKTRTLFTVWAKKRNGKIQLWVGNKPFNEFYNLNEEEVKQKIGLEGWMYKTNEEYETFVNNVVDLMKSIEKNDE